MMISNRTKNIMPSATLSIAAKAKEMKQNGIDVLSLSAGEPDYDTPEHIKEAAIQAIHEGFTKYTDTSGILALRQAICAKLRKDNSLEYNPENILVSNGAKQSLYNLLQVLVNPGDEVLIPVPYWVSYEEMVKLAQGVCVYIRTNEEFKITPEMIREHATGKTKIIILNSPSNPTGAVYTQKELEAIAAVCLAEQIFVISDEIYEKLVYTIPHYSIAQVSPAMKKQTAVVNGVSKAYAMTGWRIGYAAAEPDIIVAAGRLQDHTTSNPNSIAQKAAVAAITGSQTCVDDMREAYRKRRDAMVTRLVTMPGVTVQKPEGAFYVFANIAEVLRKKHITVDEFCKALLTQEQVAIVPGSAFGDDQCIRLSYAAGDAVIAEAMDRMERFIVN